MLELKCSFSSANSAQRHTVKSPHKHHNPQRTVNTQKTLVRCRKTVHSINSIKQILVMFNRTKEDDKKKKYNK